jgi:hypothetical protein
MLVTRPTSTAAAPTETVFLWGRFLGAVGVAGLLVAGFVLGCQPPPTPFQTALFSALVACGLGETVRGGLYRGRPAADDADEPAGWPGTVQALGSVALAFGLVVVIAAMILFDEVTVSRLQLGSLPAHSARSLLWIGIGSLALGVGGWAAAIVARREVR